MNPLRFTAPACLRACAVLLTLLCARAHAQAEPASVTMAGTFQSELGCPGDWDAACAASGLERNAVDGVWRKLFTIPGGEQQFKAALNGSWEENYGANAVRDGANLVFSHTEETLSVKFYYDPVTHWVTNSTLTPIAVLVGSFQSELGCPDDWDPACMVAWLKDIDADGVQELRIPSLPADNYLVKITHHESWTENYGQGGVFDGENIPFTVPATGQAIRFVYDTPSHILTFRIAAPTATALTATPNPSPLGELITLTASVAVTEGVAVPTGSVTFTLDGQELGTAVLGANGVATMTTSTQLVGTFTFTAEYNGVYDTSRSLPVVVTTAHGTATSLTATPEGPSRYGEQVTLQALVTTNDASAGPVSGEVVFQEGDTELGTAQVDGSGRASLALTPLTVGAHAFSARFTSQADFLPSRGEVSHTVNRATPQVTLESSLNPSDSGQSVTFTARVSSTAGTPGGSITFQEGADELATVPVNAQGVASYTTAALASGNHSLTAEYAGDTNFEPGLSEVLTQVVRGAETPDAGTASDGGTGDVDAGPAPDAGTGDTDAGSGNTDAGPGSSDAGSATDAGSSDTDAGSGPTDAGPGPGNTDAGSGNTDAGPGDTDAGTGSTDGGTSDTDAGPGNTDAGPGDTDAGPGNTDAGPGDTDAGPGNTDAGPGDADAGPGDTDAGTNSDTDAGTQGSDAGTGNTDAGTTPGTDAGTQAPDAGTSTPDDETASGCGCGAGAGGSSPLFLLGIWMGLTTLQSRRRARNQARG